MKPLQGLFSLRDFGAITAVFTDVEMGVLCAIAYQQPIGLAEVFGKEVSCDLLARLRYNELIANRLRSPRFCSNYGAPLRVSPTFARFSGPSPARPLPT